MTTSEIQILRNSAPLTLNGLTFRDYVIKTAKTLIIGWVQGGKDTTGNADAASYLSKMQTQFNNLLSGTNNAENSIFEATLLNMGAGYTIAQLIAFSAETDWYSAVSAKIVAAAELLSGVTSAERTAYNSL